MGSATHTTDMQHYQTQIPYLWAFQDIKTLILVLKEIGFYCILEYNSIRFITPQNFGSWVFFYVNCDKINIMIIGYQV